MTSDYELIGAAWRDHMHWKACVNRSLKPHRGEAALSGVQLWVLAGVIADILKVAQAFGDDALLKRMRADANATLKAIGLPPPRGVVFKLIVNTEQLNYIVIPGPPYGEPSDVRAPTPRSGVRGAYPWEKVGFVVARAWADDKFRERFMKHPREVLDANVGTLPAGITVKVLLNTKRLVHIVLWPAVERGARPSRSTSF